MSPRRNKARLVSARMLSPSVRSLRFAVEGGPVRFEAGQWVDVHVTTPAGPEKRAYSIASGPERAELELAVTLVDAGVVSPVLHGLREGDEVELDGPHGFFTREGDALRVPNLFVGTGTGLAPLRAMLDQLLRTDHPPITLLFGCRSQADILWREELEGWAREHANFRLEVSLSRPDQGWQGRRGYVQEHAVELARALGEPHVFVCGLNRMVSELRTLCKTTLGYDRKRIHTERYD